MASKKLGADFHGKSTVKYYGLSFDLIREFEITLVNVPFCLFK